jgi:hypothetical protein
MTYNRRMRIRIWRRVRICFIRVVFVLICVIHELVVHFNLVFFLAHA